MVSRSYGQAQHMFGKVGLPPKRRDVPERGEKPWLLEPNATSWSRCSRHFLARAPFSQPAPWRPARGTRPLALVPPLSPALVDDRGDELHQVLLKVN